MIMSRKSTIITVEPPSYTTSSEQLEISGYTCPYCCGQGIWSEQVGYNKYKDYTSSVCKGAKEIKAVITIEWLPDTNKQ